MAAIPAALVSPISSEIVRRIVDALIAERQDLRGRGAPANVLEANRMAIVEWQLELSHALVREHACGDAGP